MKAPAFAYLISTSGTAGTGTEKQRRPCTGWCDQWPQQPEGELSSQVAESWCLSHTHTQGQHHSPSSWQIPSHSVSILTRDLFFWTNKQTKTFHLRIFAYPCLGVYFGTAQLTNISRMNSTHMKQNIWVLETTGGSTGIHKHKIYSKRYWELLEAWHTVLGLFQTLVDL